MKINIAHIEPESYIYAPGKQFVIWVQGCGLHCRGCWNTEMWDFEPKHLIEIDKLVEQIDNTPELDGVTILGGEPFDQLEPVFQLSLIIKERGLGLTIYTGYEIDELTNPIQKKILQHTDLIHTGRYIQSKRNIDLQWTGCENKKTIFLTDFYQQKIDNANYCEIQINAEGEITLLGFPENEFKNFIITN